MKILMNLGIFCYWASIAYIMIGAFVNEFRK